MREGGSRRRALVALRERELAEAVAALARAQEDLERLDEDISRSARQEAIPVGRAPAMLLEMNQLAADRRRGRLALLRRRRSEAQALVESRRDDVVRARNARRALD